ncbi:hypothetical protein GGS21DRAFT_493877 [Xylaria nigripes]|nr:hypothetical protein GGS21DRAFT_493877 [Xylaria nigripes]
MRAAAFAALLTVASAAPAAQIDNVHVVAEAIHGGTGIDRTNTTITVPVGPLYRNEEVLDQVSTLYLLDGDGVSCIPYQSADGTGPHGLPFTVGHPSYLSTNTVVVGSIQCTKTD